MWKVIGRSEVGTSHTKSGDPCQDSHTYISNSDTLIAVCSDGAGSAPHSAVGSRAACDCLLRVASAHFESENPATPDHALLTEWFRQSREAVVNEAAQLNATPRELACTLLLAVVRPDWATFAQLGDGVIVVDGEDGYEAATWPQNGEYQNTTFFLTEEGFDSRIESKQLDRQVFEVALLTDGLQPLALNFAARKAHSPFFLPMFKALRAADDTTSLQVPFLQFLRSSAVNERTDDDKTLVLATRKLGTGDVG